MRTLRDVVIVAILLYVIVYFTTPDDPAKKENYMTTPGGDTIWVPDSTVYKQYQNRKGDSTPYKGKWIDISN